MDWRDGVSRNGLLFFLHVSPLSLAGILTELPQLASKNMILKNTEKLRPWGEILKFVFVKFCGSKRSIFRTIRRFSFWQIDVHLLNGIAKNFNGKLHCIGKVGVYSETGISISICMPFLQGQCLIFVAKKLCRQFHIRKAEAEVAGLSQKGVNLSNMFLADARLMEFGFSSCVTEWKMTAALQNW